MQAGIAQNAASAVSKGDSLINTFYSDFFSPLYQLAVGVTFAYFLFGVGLYIFQLNNEEARSKAKQHMLWGLVGLFIVFSVGGILQALSGAIGGMFAY